MLTSLALRTLDLLANTLRRWLLREGRPNFLAVGVLMIAVVWGGIIAKFLDDRNSDFKDALQANQNLTAMFEENVLRSFGEIDKTLLYLRRVIESRTSDGDIATLVQSADIKSEIIVQVAVISVHGMMVASSAAAPTSAPVNLSDREHFKVHAERLSDELFISKPVIGRASGKWSVQLTRRLRDKAGAFGGVVVASFDPEHFHQFYGQVEVGKSASYSLIGRDGVVRASAASSHDPRFRLGEQLQDTELMRRIARHHDRAAVSYSAAEANHPEVRLTTFRPVRGYPLVVSVSQTVEDIYKDSSANAVYFGLAGVVITLLILVTLRIIATTSAQSARKSLLLEATLETMSQGIIMVTKERKVAIINRKCVELLDLPPSFLTQSPSFEQLIAHQEAIGEFANAVIPDGKSALEHFGCSNAVYERQRPNGTVIEVRTTPTHEGGFVRTFADVTQRRQAQAQEIALASKDALTGLANRRVFRGALDGAVKRSELGEGGFSVLCLDLDRFKGVNDTLGHPVGDLLLQQVAKRLQSAIRKDDVLARIGGDEFAIILQSTAHDAAAQAVATRIIKVISSPYEINGQQILIGVTIGIVVCPRDAQDADNALVAADLALYAAKAAGRGTFSFFDRKMDAEVKAQRQLETELREAFDQDQLELYYQPVIDLKRKRISGFEALMRWYHPTRGFIPPSSFIPVAEDCGLIGPLGLWTLKQACLQARQWPDAIRVAVNVSPLQFLSAGFVESVGQILNECDFDPRRLELEITERILVQNDARTLATLHRLRDLGIRIAMDDFGTGYSSLSYLQSFPFDKIKIDRSFVSKLGEAPHSTAVVQAVIDIAVSLGMTTTAEGVETDAQSKALDQMNCDEAQGYLFSRPVPPSALEGLLHQWNLPTERAA